jgi:hypothetical protein
MYAAKGICPDDCGSTSGPLRWPGRVLELARARLGPGVGREELVMKIRKLGKEMTMSAFLVLLLAAACFAGASKKHVSIAVFPCTDAVMSFKKFHLLVSYLQEETGLEPARGDRA